MVFYLNRKICKRALNFANFKHSVTCKKKKRQSRFCQVINMYKGSNFFGLSFIGCLVGTVLLKPFISYTV